MNCGTWALGAKCHWYGPPWTLFGEPPPTQRKALSDFIVYNFLLKFFCPVSQSTLIFVCSSQQVLPQECECLCPLYFPCMRFFHSTELACVFGLYNSAESFFCLKRDHFQSYFFLRKILQGLLACLGLSFLNRWRQRCSGSRYEDMDPLTSLLLLGKM